MPQEKSKEQLLQEIYNGLICEFCHVVIDGKAPGFIRSCGCEKSAA